MVTSLRLTYRIRPTPITVLSVTRYRILILRCYIRINIRKQYFLDSATQIMKLKEMFCNAIFMRYVTTERYSTFVFSNVDAGFCLSGFVNSHNKIYQSAANHRFTDKSPIRVRKVCRWPAIRTTNITEPILAAIAKIHRKHILISCLVATQPVSVVNSQQCKQL